MPVKQSDVFYGEPEGLKRSLSQFEPAWVVLKDAAENREESDQGEKLHLKVILEDGAFPEPAILVIYSDTPPERYTAQQVPCLLIKKEKGHGITAYQGTVPQSNIGKLFTLSASTDLDPDSMKKIAGDFVKTCMVDDPKTSTAKKLAL